MDGAKYVDHILGLESGERAPADSLVSDRFLHLLVRVSAIDPHELHRVHRVSGLRDERVLVADAGHSIPSAGDRETNRV